MRSIVARIGALLLIYVCLVGWLTWPLAFVLATHLPDTTLPCRFDGLLGVWSLAWQAHALATDPLRFVDANIYWPAQGTLFYGHTGFGALPLFAPVYWATGNPVLATNVLILGGVALTAASLHRVVARWSGSELAGFVAAWMLLTTRWLLWTWLPMAPYYAALWYWPWILWLASRPTLARWETVVLGLLVCLQSLASLVYVTPAVVAPLGVLALARILRPATPAARWRLVGALGCAGVFLLPVVAGYARVSVDNPALAAQSAWSGDLAQVLASAGDNRVGNVMQVPLELPWWTAGNAGPLGVPHAALLVIAIGALAWRRRDGDPMVRRGWTQGILWAVVGLVISTFLVRFGHGPAHRLPWATPLVSLLGPVFTVVRDPSRLAVAALFGLTTLAGMGFAACARRLARPAAVGLAVVLTVGAYAEYRRFVPRVYPARLAPDLVDPVLAAVRAQPGPLLELASTGAPPTVFVHAAAMYRSVAHWRPMLNGYASYWPAGFESLMDLAARLPDPAALDELRRKTGVTGVLLRLTPFEPVPQRWHEYLDGGERPDLRLVMRDETTLLFAVGDTVAAPSTAGLDHPGAGRGSDGGSPRRDAPS